jgi:hypothetical protein
MTRFAHVTRTRAAARAIAVAVAALVLAAAAASAEAKPRKRGGKRATVVVEPFTGPRAAAVRSQVMRTLERNGRSVVPEGRGAPAIVSGAVERKGKRWSVSIIVRGADGAELGSHAWRGASAAVLAKHIKRSFWRELGKAVRSGRAAPAEAAVADADADRTEAATDRPRWARVKVTLDPFTGPQAGKLRDDVRAVLERRGADIVGDGEGGAVAAIGGEVDKKGKRWRFRVTVRGSGGDELASKRWAERGAAPLRASVKREVWATVGPALDRASAVASQVASDERDERDDAPTSGSERDAADTSGDDVDGELSAEVSTGAAAGRRPALEVSVGIGMISRSLSYNDDIFAAIPTYDLAAAPTFVGSLDWYPAAHGSTGWLANLGLTADLELAYALDTETSEGATYDTSASGFHIGARQRFYLGRVDANATITYGSQSFGFDDGGMGMAPAPVPDVTYDHLRFGGGVRAGFVEKFGAGLSAAYRHVLGAGEMDEAGYFPRMDVAGIDAGAFATWALARRFELRVAFSVQRYFFSLNPEPGDAYIAGGAIDQYLGTSLSLVYR